MSTTITARGPLKVVAVIDPAELLDVPVPDGKPRVVLAIRLPGGTVTADLAAKSVRRAIAAVREHGPDGWPLSYRAGSWAPPSPRPGWRCSRRWPSQSPLHDRR